MVLCFKDFIFKIGEDMSKYKGKFDRLEKAIYHMIMDMASDIFKILLEEYDEEILENRDKRRYRNIGLRNQNLKTIFGTVQYKRHLYFDRKKGSYVFLLDENLELETVGNYTVNLVDRIKQLVTEVPYREVEEQLENLTNIRLSHQSVWNLVQKLGGEIYSDYEDMKNKKQSGMIDTEILFEEHDGVYLKSREKSNDKGIEVKAGTLYTGWEKTGENKYKLENKVVFAAAISCEKFLEIKENLAGYTYDMYKVKHRVMNCDGAGWTFRNSDQTSIKQLDFFHIKQSIYLAINDKKQIKTLYGMLINKEYDKMLEHIKVIKNGCNDVKRKKRVDDLYRYLSTHREELERYKTKLKYNGIKELRNMGIQENQNYILITKRMKHRRMAWTKKGATNLALLVCDEINSKTWNKAKRLIKKTTLDDEVLVKATSRSVNKISGYFNANGEYGINDRILSEMISRLKRVSFA